MPTPYGEWESPVDAEQVAASGIDLGQLELADGTAYWLERRPSEDGRGVVVRAGEGDHEEVTPADHDVRTLVHEYGGGDFTVADGDLYYARMADQRLYHVDLGAEEPAGTAAPLTPEPETEHGHRYADIEVTPDGDRLYAVRERHEGPDTDEEPVNELVTLPAAGGEPTVVASGRDFYSFPRLSPDGEHLAWTTWDHPQMPWDGTVLHVADVADDGTLDHERGVMGGPEESVFQPSWGPDGRLYAVSDRSGWWNLYRLGNVRSRHGEPEPEPLHETEEEFGTPQWRFGLATYAPLSDGRIACVHGVGDDWALGLLDPETGALEDLETGYAVYPHTRLQTDGEELLTVAASPSEPESVVRVGVGGDGDGEGGATTETLRRSLETDLPERYVSEPESVTFETGDDEVAHAIYYPPHNPDSEAPDGDSPPLLTMVHGGPTSQTMPTFDLAKQFFTTRGVGVVDVNYRGSTGYGRDYRERLNGEWGVVDTEDCVRAAEHLAKEGRADPDRLAIRGGSAGGYATLCALAFHDAFDAGVSYYGVADLRALAEHTHKFESRYLDSMVGPLPEAADVYEARSPVHHAEGIGAPLLLLQGSEDAVVPPEQAEVMVEALAANGLAHAYVEFDGERHGFRREDSRRRALELEYSFLGQVFGFEPADDLERVELVGGD